MKPLTLVLAGSLAANLACAVALALRPTLAPPAVREFFHLHDAAAEARQAVDARREAEAAAQRAARQAAASRALLWSALDTGGVKALVANLRAAGFSPAAIRALAFARIDAQFRNRRKEIADSITQKPYWVADPLRQFGGAQVYEQMSALYGERSRAMRDVLGLDFMSDDATDPNAAIQYAFGNIPKAKLDLIQRIADDYEEMARQVRQNMERIALPEDREKLALLEREKRADLAATLTPEELRDYDLHQSKVTGEIRTALTLIDASEAEFRTIYDIHAPFAAQLYVEGDGRDPAVERQQDEARKKVEEQLTAALGAQRTAEFLRAGDWEYQSIYRLAQREKLGVETANRVYDLRTSIGAESMLIYRDKNRTPEQRRDALQSLAQTATTQLIAALGPATGRAYVGAADWLNHVAAGGAVSFSRDGNTYLTPISSTATPPAPAK